MRNCKTNYFAMEITMCERSQAELTVEEQTQSRAAQKLVEAAGGTLSAHMVSGKSEGQLSKYGRPNYTESMPLSAIEALEAVTHGKHGHPHVTRYLANKAGYALVKLPEVTATGSDLLKLLAVQSKEGGDIANEICTSIADGEIDGQEAANIRKELWELIRNAVAMDAELELIERGEL